MPSMTVHIPMSPEATLRLARYLVSSLPASELLADELREARDAVLREADIVIHAERSARRHEATSTPLPGL